MSEYRAMISSDWNECLAPCGPFDYIAFTYPHLSENLDVIFRGYTGNRINLEAAVQQVVALLPEPITAQQMDAYLKSAFRTYTGVAELLAWCRERRILFMINTTGAVGYFQRVLANRFLPRFPALSAYPDPCFSAESTDPDSVYDLLQVQDKGVNTEKVGRAFNIPPHRIAIMGDSGGDGPHFKWAAENGVFLVASMPKSSLRKYCKEAGFQPDYVFGKSYDEGEPIDRNLEMAYDFMALTSVFEDRLGAGQ
ncbi:MAG: hypothetical protein LJE94_15545 [Deltaproteobacteria bacterium]|nr:hypothetical protein [Deltaproteobacteria bacterium]